MKKKTLSYYKKHTFSEIELKIQIFKSLLAGAKLLSAASEILKEQIRKFIRRHGILDTKTGVKTWKGEKEGAQIQPALQYVTDPYLLIELISLDATLPFIKIDYGKLEKAVKNKKIQLTRKQLKSITKITFGKEKVFPL